MKVTKVFGGIASDLSRSRLWKAVYATQVRGRLLLSSLILKMSIPHLSMSESNWKRLCKNKLTTIHQSRDILVSLILASYKRKILIKHNIFEVDTMELLLLLKYSFYHSADIDYKCKLALQRIAK